MEETCLTDECIKPNLVHSFYKMIYEPFEEKFSSKYRFFSGSKKDLEHVLENKIQNKLHNLSYFINNDGYIVKRDNISKKYKIFKAPKLQKGESSLELMGGDTWFINDINKDNTMDYNLAVISYLLNNKRKMTPDENYKIYNSYHDLVYNIMDDNERKVIKDTFEKRCSLINSQLVGGSNEKSTIHYINAYRLSKFHQNHPALKLSFDIVG